VIEDETVSPTVAGTPRGGVISPLLSNVYLHVLDVRWTRHSAPLGELVRYADDFVVMCRTRNDCEPAEERIRNILHLPDGPELHLARRAEALVAVDRLSAACGTTEGHHLGMLPLAARGCANLLGVESDQRAPRHPDHW
jgi:hypothetical protein